MSALGLASLRDEELLAAVGAMDAAVSPAPPVDAAALAAARRTPLDVASIAAEPIECVTKRYRCPHCRRFSRSKRAPVVAHMARCWMNPAVRACKTCVFFQPGRTGASDPCIPGRLCGCDTDNEACLHEDGPDLSGGLRDHCPLWALRGAS